MYGLLSGSRVKFADDKSKYSVLQNTEYYPLWYYLHFHLQSAESGRLHTATAFGSVSSFHPSIIYNTIQYLNIPSSRLHYYYKHLYIIILKFSDGSVGV